MTLRDLVNPWAALELTRQNLADRDWEIGRSRRALRDKTYNAATDEKAYALKLYNLQAEIERLKAIIASGHHRNPETGRLGRKGELFPQRAPIGGRT